MNQPWTGFLRVACNDPCRVEYARDKFDAVVWNVSVQGAYLALGQLLPEKGETIRVTFLLDGEPVPIVARARVAWLNPPEAPGAGRYAWALPPGCGVQFIALQDADHGRITAHVRKTYPHVDGEGRAPAQAV